MKVFAKVLFAAVVVAKSSNSCPFQPKEGQENVCDVGAAFAACEFNNDPECVMKKMACCLDTSSCGFEISHMNSDTVNEVVDAVKEDIIEKRLAADLSEDCALEID